MPDRLTAALADRYRVERELGAGGMATVYLARDLRHDRAVALKVLRPELAAALGPGRFLREITTTAQLAHPHILPLLDSGEAGGMLFYVMPYVEGESLRGRLERERQLPLDDALQIACEVADALSYAHSHGVIHRDIKPENILLQGGHAVVADFGIARAVNAVGGTRLTETGLAIGTPAYMSPEQASGSKDLDGRSDLYSLGCVLYEMLSGETPYTGPTAQAILAKKLSEPLPRVSVVRETVPAGIEAALARALARTPADRFVTAAEFAAALAHPETVHTGAPTGGLPPSRRRAVRLGAAAVVAVTAAGAAIGWRVLAARHAAGNPGPNTLAVLAFDNATKDTSLDWLADGLADEIATDLAGAAGMSVRAAGIVRSASRVAAGDPQRIGRLVSVRYVVEGSYRRVGSRVRVSAHVVSLPAGDEHWGRVYDTSHDSLPTLSSTIASDLASAFGASAPRIGRRPPDPQAYELYRRGRFFLDRYDIPTARSLFEQAIQHDSSYAAAWAGLAEAWGELADNVVPAMEAWPHIRGAAQRALALDSTSGSAYVSLAGVAVGLDQDFVAGLRLAERAASLDSTLPEAWGTLAWMLAWNGRRDDALAALRRGWEADSLSTYMAIYVGDVTRHIAPERFESALNMVRQRLPSDLARLWDAWVALRHHDCATAARLPPGGDPASSVLRARALVCLGRRPEAESVVSAFIADTARRFMDPVLLALAPVALGDSDGAIRWLERAADEHSGWVEWINFEPDFAPLRSDPRFVALERRLGLQPVTTE